MAAVVRVKRRRDENPADSLLFSCKKAKQSNVDDVHFGTEEDELKSIFKYAGTLGKNDKCVSKQVREAIKKEKLEKEYKKHSVDINSTARESQRNSSTSSRYKLISQKRSLNIDDLDKEVEEDVSGSSKSYSLYDVIPDVQQSNIKPAESDKHNKDVILCNGVAMEREKLPATVTPEDTEYVYDIYYMNNAKFDFEAFNNIVSIEAYQIDFLDARNCRGSDEEFVDDDDDENAECNWRNDYPDEDPHYYDTELGGNFCYGAAECEEDNSIVKKLENLDLFGGADDLSSDSEEDRVYFKEPLCPSDVWTPTTSYEKYKTKVLKHLESDNYNYGDDDNEFEND